ncbi:MAG: superoxide dismutase, Ni [Candidatus Levybacteria bacterium RIFCSPHIGHO2_01_FULL_40_10]|nr:MAG: superoxide dismutase, Ni [Candidatus Levybacteria bacterium RIFCSPHIGHO2_01_FULL_40_10]
MRLLLNLLKVFPSKTAYAHCDIPCGIYDPTPAQIAAHTIIRMTQLIAEVKREDETKAEHDIARIVHVKEEHGHLVEDELGTLENDYFKPEHYKKYPELAGLLSSAVALSIKVRQNIDMEAANELLDQVQKIAEIFYKTKNFEPVRIPSGYPTGGEIVSHK